MKIGIIGCGNISKAYFEGAQQASNLELVACADLRLPAAKEKAATYGCRACTTEELLAIPEIDLVVNLTLPQAHVDVGLQVLEAGKHLYTEKPIGLDLESVRRLLATAKERNLRVGNAPDTFLFGAAQTARQLIDQGTIGQPISGIATMMCHGHEHWHPNPSFYYDLGGGPMLDMGPYYLHTLINLLGPVKSVSGFSSQAFKKRTATSEGALGQEIDVNVPTHYAGTLLFASGALINVVMSFDVWESDCPPLQLFGTEGSLLVGDPNTFNGPPRFQQKRDEWQTAEIQHPANARMIGVVDMVQAIRDNRPHRANGQNALHVLEVMLAFEKSGQTGQHIDITSPASQPAALPAGLPDWTVD